MKKVICIDDTNLIQGASIESGKEYIVINEYANALDQRVYIIKGAVNEGTSKMGMRWVGYRADRFREVDTIEQTQEEYAYALN